MSGKAIDESKRIVLNIELCDAREKIIEFLKSTIKTIENGDNYDNSILDHFHYNDSGSVTINTIQ
jgi:hypothetical protein